MAKCLNPSCKEPETSRGLCKKCYVAARLLVKGNHTTWEKLEAAKRCTAAKTRGWDSPTRKWFLTESTSK